MNLTPEDLDYLNTLLRGAGLTATSGPRGTFVRPVGVDVEPDETDVYPEDREARRFAKEAVYLTVYRARPLDDALYHTEALTLSHRLGLPSRC